MKKSLGVECSGIAVPAGPYNKLIDAFNISYLKCHLPFNEKY